MNQALNDISSILTLAIYSLVLYPFFWFILMKYKYGDKIKVFFNIGQGMLKEYKKGLIEKNDGVAFIRNMHQKNLKAMAFNYGSKVGFSFLDPELIKQVHQNHEYFIKMDATMAVTFLFGNSILYAKGKEWQKQRQFLGKSFHFDEIKSYFPQIKEICQNTFRNTYQKLTNEEQINIQAVKICETVTSEVIFRTFFGKTSQNLNITKKDGSQILLAFELVEVVKSAFQMLTIDKIALIKWIFLQRNSARYFRTEKEEDLFQRLTAIKECCLQIVQKRRDELIKEPTQAKKIFLDQYLIDTMQNQSSQVTDDEIIDNFCGMFFAGTDTTANMTGVALYYLSIYPEIQRQAREEIIKILSSKSNDKNPDSLFSQFSIEDLSNLDLINSILKESMRLIPPAIQVFPRIACQDIKIGEFEIKKGQLVTTNFVYNQSNPEIFPKPDNFDPFRWMNEDNTQSNTFNFTPFSQGPRNCIGQHLAMIEGKCMLVYILLLFDILPNPSVLVAKEVKVIYGFQNDNLIYFKKRQNII
ncbi:cytochrome P450 family monooxygenase (macronuclear) [Tetrahymena thermophila SB210]|uniref:Cytochrome P450 family monooxygenase n=1 Tax=Tetrahymena thermophila (strain SB210) TaxID=312017 RepID=Q22NL7_TETTS|nr:cytochrome P450 family monooxygenase [Tetrahymena thermophila SB210]EAR86768.2 cytochrome P450 family monooxygenase [Tetrahymena thermophila SB210]|eukprot:XP_001007013.2 cytochrome P450 family monooxygenase [Tetrahymena thermophila SB210]